MHPGTAQDTRCRARTRLPLPGGAGSLPAYRPRCEGGQGHGVPHPPATGRLRDSPAGAVRCEASLLRARFRGRTTWCADGAGASRNSPPTRFSNCGPRLPTVTTSTRQAIGCRSPGFAGSAPSPAPSRPCPVPSPACRQTARSGAPAPPGTVTRFASESDIQHSPASLFRGQLRRARLLLFCQRRAPNGFQQEYTAWLSGWLTVQSRSSRSS